MRLLILICLCAWQTLRGQVPYFNVQFDYQNRLETSVFGIETDSFYIIPVKGASPLKSVADTSFVLTINKFTTQTNYKKISYYEGQSVRNILKGGNGLFIHGNKYNAPKEFFLVDNDEYFSLVDTHNFDTISLKHFGLPGKYDAFYRPILTSDGGIFSAGWSFGLQQYDRSSLLVFKCDSNLNQQFLKLYSVSQVNNHFGGGVVETPDKGFIIVGTRQVGNPVKYSYGLIVKVDSSGNLVFWKEIPHQGDTIDLILVDVKPIGTGNYIAVGSLVFDPRVGPGWERSWVVGFDAQGNLLWSKAYAENERSGWQSITPSLDGNFYACGYERDFADAIYKQYATVSKLAPNGDLIWHRKYSIEPTGKHFDNFFNVLATSDGGILCNGTTFGHDGSLQNAWVMKLDAWGCASPGCQTGVGVEELPVGLNSWVVLSPNPTAGTFRVEATGEHRIEALRIVDLGGRVLLDRRGLREAVVEADLGSEAAGAYVVSVLVDGVWQVRQVHKVRH
mgnify:CR=1 FL=1